MIPWPRLPDRNTLVFAAGGLFAYFLSQWLMEAGSFWLLAAVSVSRLAVGALSAAAVASLMEWKPRGSMAWLAIAAPYPVDLAVTLYWRVARTAAEAGETGLLGPTSEIIFIASLLLGSHYLTAWTVQRAASAAAEPLRTMRNLMFALTGVGILLMPGPVASLWFLARIAEPVALAGYCAVLAAGPPRGAAIPA
jgi:hypothetical protein